VSLLWTREEGEGVRRGMVVVIGTRAMQRSRGFDSLMWEI
jgi:hypothetical protein